MKAEDLILGNTITEKIKEVDSVLYYADVYKEQKHFQAFEFHYEDSDGNKRCALLGAYQTEEIIEMLKIYKEKLKADFEKL